MNKVNDPVNHPSHYTTHPSGVECIQVTEHMNFCLGNAVKYIWRADLKGNSIQDLEKAVFYINREISRRKNDENNNNNISHYDHSINSNLAGRFLTKEM